jgi:SAM-dependent methyltransferase
MTKSFWDLRYAESDFAYGKEPNQYFREKLENILPGTMLLPADGEGRNAVYAARNGWQTTSFDISESGKEKALQLAASQNVSIRYEVADASEFLKKFEANYDLVACCYTHFPETNRVLLHSQLAQRVRSGGILIFECFAKGHELYNEKNPEVGGPKDRNMLFSEEELLVILDGFEILELDTTVTELSEGKYHRGRGLVVRAIAKKP